MDPEERELQIKLAQINAEIQIGIAVTFGFLATALTLLILGYQIWAQYRSEAIVGFVTAIASAFLALLYMRRVFGYSDELDKLQ